MAMLIIISIAAKDDFFSTNPALIYLGAVCSYSKMGIGVF
jgi:hypothetical protein